MEKPLEKTFQVIEDITDFRYQIEQSFLDQLDAQSARTGNAALEPLLKGGLRFLHSAVEGRYHLEKTLLARLRSGLGGEAPGSEVSPTVSPKDHQAAMTPPPVINTGTILIRAVPGQRQAEVPLNLNNPFLIAQTVAVEVPPFRHLDSGEELPGKISVDRERLTLPPQGSVKLKLSVDLQEGFESGGRYFTTLLLRGKEVRLFQLVIEMLSGQDKKAQPSITFTPVEP